MSVNLVMLSKSHGPDRHTSTVEQWMMLYLTRRPGTCSSGFLITLKLKITQGNCWFHAIDLCLYTQTSSALVSRGIRLLSQWVRYIFIFNRMFICRLQILWWSRYLALGVQITCARCANNVRSLWTFTACDIFNLTLRPGLIMPQTSDDSLFALGVNWFKCHSDYISICYLSSSSSPVMC